VSLRVRFLRLDIHLSLFQARDVSFVHKQPSDLSFSLRYITANSVEVARQARFDKISVALYVRSALAETGKEEMRMRRVTAAVSCVRMLLGVGLLTLGAGNPAEAGSKCTVGTLKGNYVYAQDGFTIEGDTAAQRTPFAQIGREIFDGKGNMSGTASASLNGTIVRSTYAGTYAVNSDCSGTVTFTDNFNQTFHYDIFIRDGGREFVFIQTDAGVVTAAYERRK
jgi:hypothetical protein